MSRHKELKEAVSFYKEGEEVDIPKFSVGFIPVDQWEPLLPEDIIIQVQKGYFIVPFTEIYGLNIDSSKKFDYFVLSTKKCYNSQDMRFHLYQYVNYFEKYYDKDHEYISILFRMKTIMDKFENYDVKSFFYDLYRYILTSDIEKKVAKMVEDNYFLKLSYVNLRSPSLQYTDYHAKLLFRMSILMDLIIPLLTNYAYMHRIDNIDDYLLSAFDMVLHLYEVDMYSKLYETAYTNIYTNQKTNQGIWDKQDIRAIDITTHSTHSVRNIILNIMPKYTFTKNIISFNCASIRENTRYQVTDIGFEYSYVPISSSKRDEDSVSDFDRFESALIKQSEAAYMQNKVNYQVVMDTIRYQFGPFDEREIKLYIDSIMTAPNGDPTINGFQRNLIFDMFYKYFRDVQSIRAINRVELAQLIIALKKILLSKNMKLLPYVITGKVEKLVTRKNVNKKELMQIEASPTWPLILEKYKNPNIKKYIQSIVATIISSDFSIVDMNPNIHGKRIEMVVPIIIEELLIYIFMC